MTNMLYYGDNLEILRRYIKDESVDLIYLDPPFKSNQSYNVLFKERNGSDSAAQIGAFDDTWHWDRKAEDTLSEIMEACPPKVVNLMDGLIQIICQRQFHFPIPLPQQEMLPSTFSRNLALDKGSKPGASCPAARTVLMVV